LSLCIFDYADLFQVHGLTAASLAACVGPALTQQNTSTTPGHMGFDICAAIAFLIKNYREVFRETSADVNAQSVEYRQPVAADVSSRGLETGVASFGAEGRSRSQRLPAGDSHSDLLLPLHAQDRAPRPESSRPAVGHPQRMDNLLTSIAGLPCRQIASTVTDSHESDLAHKHERGRSCSQRSQPPGSQPPVCEPQHLKLLCESWDPPCAVC
jgi:hypothetical protein